MMKAQHAGAAGFGAGGIDQAALGLSDKEASFEQAYTRWGFPKLKRKNGVDPVTPPLDKVLEHPTIQARFKGWAPAMLGSQKYVVEDNDHEKAKEHVKAWLDSKPSSLWDRGQEKALLGENTETKATTDSGVVGIPSADGAVPLVYDPDILQILKDSTPLLDRLTTRGQQGFKAVSNRLDARGGPLGFVSEGTSADLTSSTPSSPTYGQTEKEMEILVDLVEVTDFAQMATEIQFDLRDSALGSAIAALGQLKERAVLYGDNSQATASGGIGDGNAYDGFETDIENNKSANHIDKSTTTITGTLGLVKDIKSEVKAFLQSDRNVNPQDLLIGTSHTIVGQNENEFQDFVRIATEADGVNFGGGELRIHGIPVVPTHNVDAHTDGAFTPGDEGDVFILNQRSAEFRSLMPMSSVPLGRRGFADLIAIGEFGAPILRANAEWSKYLSSYSVTQLT